jgi:hypothetical protein
MSVYQGKVTGHHPSAPLSQCVVVVPQMTGVSFQVAKLPYGLKHPPAIGSPVWVAYEGGDVSFPVVLSVVEPAPDSALPPEMTPDDYLELFALLRWFKALIDSMNP